MRILIAEDDLNLGESLVLSLSRCQHTADWVKNGAAAWSALQTEHFDLLILDLDLPMLRGEEVLRRLRANNMRIPVIILTSLNEIHRRVSELDNGADDYVSKPFDNTELIARINSIKRRIDQSYGPRSLTAGGITLEPDTRLVFKNGKLIDISRREFALLQVLLENIGRVLTRDQATQALYGWGYDIDSNALEVHVHNLRKKLDCRDNLKTVRGVGYTIVK